MIVQYVHTVFDKPKDCAILQPIHVVWIASYSIVKALASGRAHQHPDIFGAPTESGD
jgi:hypothetical protein